MLCRRRPERELAELTAACPEMTALASLVTSFAALLAPDPGNDARLRQWITGARTADLPHVHSFTRGLDLDIQAATAALTLPHHNGRTEGVNTKTKMIKRTDVRTRRLHPAAPPDPPRIRSHTVTTESATEPLFLQSPHSFRDDTKRLRYARDRVVGWRDPRLPRSGCSVSASGDFGVRRVPGICQPGHLCRSPPAHLVALPGQLVFETSSGCGPVKAAAQSGCRAAGIPARPWRNRANRPGCLWGSRSRCGRPACRRS